MIVYLDDGVAAEVILNQELYEHPHWDLRGLRLWLGPYRSTDQWVEHASEAIGSTDVDATAGTDELLFDKDDLLLRSARCIVPEVNLPTGRLLTIWQSQPPTFGLLRLISPHGFRLEPTRIRWFAEDGTSLAGFSDAALVETSERLRLHIAKDIDLLFADRRLCGWWLSNPSYYLVTSWDLPYPSEPDGELIDALRRYLLLIAEPNIDLMEDGDPSVLHVLIELHAQLNPTMGSIRQRRVVREAIADIVDQFYNLSLN